MPQLITNTNYISTSALYDPNYIAHHGIKGQKWGVRRFQNEDGSLKAAGEKRYGGSDGGEKKTFMQRETERGQKQFRTKKGRFSLVKAGTAKFRSKAKAAGKVGLGLAGTLGIAAGASAAQLTAAGAALLASPFYAPILLAPLAVGATAAVIGRGRDKMDATLANIDNLKKLNKN